jgi:hypothetical protein
MSGEILKRHPKFTVLVEVQTDLFLFRVGNITPLGRLIAPWTVPFRFVTPRISQSQEWYLTSTARSFDINVTHARYTISMASDQTFASFGLQYIRIGLKLLNKNIKQCRNVRPNDVLRYCIPSENHDDILELKW